MTEFLSYLKRLPRAAIVALALVSVILVGMIDYFTGYEISFSVFYLAAIALATWYVGRHLGWLVSMLSVVSWLTGDLAAGATYSNRFVPIWNSVIAFVFYLVLVEALSNLKTSQLQLEAKVIERTAALTEEMTKREELEKELLEVGERERRRIGHDLHDSLCQHLTGTALVGQAVSEKLAAKAFPEEAEVRRVVTLIEDGITLARNLARGLAPVELEAEGLMAAFHELAKTTTERFNIDCRFEAPHPVLIDDSATSTHLFRIAQEAVSNAIKHGSAQRVTIGLFHEAEDMNLVVIDDGGGFREPLMENRGMGLHIMRHRAAMIGATLTIRRQSPGTVVHCRLRSEPGPEIS
ncbi:MAG: sensor histidine kinase [Chthoniobacter sp.]|nr:sensor histidine kinase [Chthoniobacter sp.]